MTDIRYRMPAIYRDSGTPIMEVIRRGSVRGLEMAAEEARGFVIREIRGAEPYPVVDTGLMAAGQVWDFSTTGVGDQMSIRLGPAPPVLTRTVVMEHGRRPGRRRPPLDAILQWVRRKRLVDANQEGSGNIVKGQMQEWARRGAKGKSGKALKGKAAAKREVELDLAIVIRNSIGKRGIRARRFYAKSIARIRARAPVLIRQAIAASLRRGFPK